MSCHASILRLALTAAIWSQTAFSDSVSQPRALSDCSSTGNGYYDLSTFNATTTQQSKQRIEECSDASNIRTVSLNNGTLTDAVGNIAGFDDFDEMSFGPGGAGYSLTNAFAICSNGYLAVNGITTYFSCYRNGIWRTYLSHMDTNCIAIVQIASPCNAGNGPTTTTASSIGTNVLAASTSSALTMTSSVPNTPYTTASISTPTSSSSTSMTAQPTSATVSNGPVANGVKDEALPSSAIPVAIVLPSVILPCAASILLLLAYVFWSKRGQKRRQAQVHEYGEVREREPGVAVDDLGSGVLVHY